MVYYSWRDLKMLFKTPPGASSPSNLDLGWPSTNPPKTSLVGAFNPSGKNVRQRSNSPQLGLNKKYQNLVNETTFRTCPLFQPSQKKRESITLWPKPYGRHNNCFRFVPPVASQVHGAPQRIDCAVRGIDHLRNF